MKKYEKIKQKLNDLEEINFTAEDYHLIFEMAGFDLLSNSAMTHDKMFEEIGCPDELKKCQAELKRQKKFIEKQSDIILALEKDIELKDNIILVLKNK